MANSKNYMSFKLSEETYNRLTRLKHIYNCTYTEVIEKLIECELKNNYVKEIHDFLFVTKRNEYYFRILFKKQESIIEYHTDKGFVRDKKNWKIDPIDKTIFTKFMNTENSLILLKNMGNSMEFNNFIILRL